MMDFEKLDTSSYFSFFGLPISFYVDSTILKAKYYELSKQLHPDFHTLADNALQDKVLQLSAFNNKAYKTLKNEKNRISYIIDLFKSPDEAKSTVPQAFLMEMMEINESMMELQFEPDPQRKEALFSEINGLIESLELEKKDILSVKDILTAVNPLIQTAQDLYYKLQYIHRLKTNLESEG